ncbi:hypothetical protein F5Y17DRAFT_463991 [Xylariaceae sp. FL0594]|nr:hypothetical protein F5Y17DRAFT_463991 [Xylariaceae sp. FL0594]
MVIPTPPRARRVVKYLVVLLVLGLALDFTHRLYNFANLFRFFDFQSGIVLQQREVLDIYNARKVVRQGEQNQTNGAAAVSVIPKILHQVFHIWSDPTSTTTILTEVWQRAQRSYLDLNPEWEYKLWTAKWSRDFIEEEYPWFLPTYDGYKLPIQRVDVIRYFALMAALPSHLWIRDREASRSCYGTRSGAVVGINWDSPWFGWAGSHVGVVVSEIHSYEKVETWDVI